MASFEDVYKQYYKDVFCFLRGLTANEDLAEELTGETFLKAFKSLNQFRGECNIRVWLCQIAKNTYYTYLKKTGKITGNLDGDYVHFISEDNIEKLLIDKELAFDLHIILHNLKEPYKEVFSLRIFGELSFKQIGMLFGKSEQWACVTYHRAKNIIKKEMGD